MPVSFELRLFMQLSALLTFITGILWILGAPRYGSAFGFRFINALKSQAVWRALHHGMGKLAVLLSLILAVPLATVESTLFLQIPSIIIISLGGLHYIRRSVGA